MSYFSFNFISTAVKNMKLRNKLLLTYMIVTIIPITIIGVFSYIKSSKMIIKQTQQYTSLVVSQINSEIDAYIKKYERLTYTVYSNIELQKILATNQKAEFRTQLNNRDKVRQYLLGINIMDSNINGVYIYSKYGELYSQNTSETGNINSTYCFEQEEWYNDIANGNIRALLLPTHIQQKHTKQKQDKEMDFTYIRQLTDINSGRYLGFLLIDIDVQAIKEIIGQATTKIKGKILIFNDENYFIYDSTGNLFTTSLDGKYFKMKKEYKELINDVSKNNIVIVNKSDYTQWKVVYIADIFYLMKDVKDIRNFTFFITIFCIILFIFISTWISLGISKPINKLKETMNIVDNGDLNISVDIVRKDEIGQLAKSFNRMIKNIKSLIKENYEIQLRKKDAELSALQSQINPHFMYNTLESVNMMAILSGNFKISDILTSFGNILRFNLDNKENTISIEKELRYVIDYLNIQKIRYKDKFDILYDIEPTVKKYKILKLTIQPLVENAIFHGISEKEGKGKIQISIKNRYKNIQIVVKDNGIGMTSKRLEEINKSFEKEEALSKKGSIGLNNINERVKLYFGRQYGLKIFSRENIGTVVELLIPAILIDEGRNECV